MQISGILPINKPLGIRSTACVDIVRKTLGRKIKVGHGGTLDSTASGMLVLLIGQATRLSNLIMDMPKVYEVKVKFGTSTSTDDATGDIVEEKEWSHITEKELDDAIPSFLGWRLQTPPVVSAVHVNGERAHALFRSGNEVVLTPKPVFFMKVERISPLNEDGTVSFRIHCRRGTYIRSFARDLGALLGTAAHVEALCRISVGSFYIDDSYQFNDENVSVEDLKESLLPLKVIAENMNSYELDSEQSVKVINGLTLLPQYLKRSSYSDHTTGNDNVVLVSDDVISLSALKKKGNSYLVSPQVNIITNRSSEN